MKILGFTALPLVYALGCGPRYAVPPALPASATHVSNPTEAQRLLQTTIATKTDLELYDEERFLAPCDLTYELKAGDRGDYAICAAALLDGDVEQGYIVSLNKEQTEAAHTVFASKYRGFWGVNSAADAEYRSNHFFTLPEAIADSVGRGKYASFTVYDYKGVNISKGNENLEGKLKKVGTFRLKK